MTLSSRQCRTCDAPATATRVLRITPGRVRRTFGCVPSSHIVKDGIRRLVFPSTMHLCRDDTLARPCSSSSPPCTFAVMTLSSWQRRTCDAPATATRVLRITPGRVRRTFGASRQATSSRTASAGPSSSPPCTFAAMTLSSRQRRTCDAPATPCVTYEEDGDRFDLPAWLRRTVTRR